MYNAEEKKFALANAVFKGMENVNDYFWQEAYITDDAEKLLALKREEKIKKRGEYRLWYKGIACFVCFAIAVSVLLVNYIRENAVPDNRIWDGFEAIEGEIRIDGIDMLNYYSARRVIENTLCTQKCVVEVRTLSYDGAEKEDGDNEKDGCDVFYYEFDPAWDYTLSKVIYFRAELKEKNGFIATMLGGVGEIDVIITQNSIEDMITFRRGALYYSCLVNSVFSDGKKERMEFSTHKYTDGFGIVKNMEQDNYVFKVLIEKGTVVELDCDYDECSDGNWDLEADRISVVSGSSITSKTNATFNISELEGFYNSRLSPGFSDAIKAYTRRRLV